MAMKIVLNSSHSIFPSLPSATQEIFLYSDCCWHNNPSGFYKKLIPCESDCCCETRVTVEQETRLDGSKYFKLASKLKLNVGPPPNCSLIDGTCKYICTAIDSIDVGDNLAQEMDVCTDTCSTEWSTPDSYAVDGGISKTPQSVQYFTRRCNGYTQIKFGSFLYNPDSPNTCTITDLMNKAIIQVMHNQATFTTSFPDSFQVFLPTCYELVEYPDNQHVVKVCYWADNCCKATYYVQKIGAESFVSSASYVTSGYVSCGLRTECEFICDNDHIQYNGQFKMSNIEIDNNLFYSDVKIHPNPTNDKIQFEIRTELTQKLSIEIYDNSGKLIFSQKLENSNNQIVFDYNTNGLQNGIYLFKIKSGMAEINTGKFIKK